MELKAITIPLKKKISTSKGIEITLNPKTAFYLLIHCLVSILSQQGNKLNCFSE